MENLNLIGALEILAHYTNNPNTPAELKKVAEKVATTTINAIDSEIRKSH